VEKFADMRYNKLLNFSGVQHKDTALRFALAAEAKACQPKKALPGWADSQPG